MRVLIACAVLLVFAPGAPAQDKKAAVSGVLTLDGKPLAECMISFHPADDTKVPFPAKTDKDGKYTIEVPAGEYTVTCLKIVVDEAKKKAVTVTPDKYASPRTSGIKASVKGAKLTFDLALVSK